MGGKNLLKLQRVSQMETIETAGIKFLDAFNAKLPMFVKDAGRYFGTFVLFELVDSVGETVDLRTYLTDWEFKDGERILTTSSETTAEWGIISTLAGDSLTEIRLVGRECVAFCFASGRSFLLTANFDEYEREDELFTIVAPERYAIDYSPATGFCFEGPDDLCSGSAVKRTLPDH